MHETSCLDCGCSATEKVACSCKCTSQTLKHQLIQIEENCPLENDEKEEELYCFNIEFFATDPKTPTTIDSLSLEDLSRLDYLLADNSKIENTKVKIEKDKKTMVLKIPKTSLQSERKIKSKATQSLLKIFDKTIYLLDEKEVITTLTTPSKKLTSPSLVSIASGISKTWRVTSIASEVAFSASSMIGLDPSGMLIGFVQFVKTIVIFRFINTNFGSLLEEVLSSLAEYTSIKPALSKNEIIENQNGWKGKINTFNTPLSFSMTYYSKIVVYLLSWGLRVVSFFLTIYFRKKGKMNKWAFYFMIYQKRLHFASYNIFLGNGIMLASRTLLHTSTNPIKEILIFDKMVALFCLLLFMYDSTELLKSTYTTIYTSSRFTSSVKPIQRSQDEEKVKVLPYSHLSPEKAKELGYVARIDHADAIYKIGLNRPFDRFIESNISDSKSSLKHKFLIRIDGPLLRLRIGIF